MNLGELIVKARNIGNMFASWFLIDTNVDSIELLGDDMEGYRVKVELKQEPINEEELADKALTSAIELNKELDNTMTTDQEYWYQEGYRDGYRKAMEE